MGTKSIPLSDAKLWAETWQKENTNRAKAFLIPIGDLIMCFKEMGVVTEDSSGNMIVNNIPDAAIRAYMATNPNFRDKKDGFGDKLILVGTEKDGSTYRDIIQDERNVAGNGDPIGSGAFDLTTPCPSECDPNSPLFF
ncbi:hypothetical protein [Pontimicrobium sp. IMCC45349]|uniref:hypothetical protein n=1 Tax=Pontimicrobium sp. IMCC45349 TaxID=3391574 RepID=UPI0039A33203